MRLFRDPIPTPAARSGRVAVVAGLAGWSALLLGGALYAVSLTLADDANLRAGFRVAAGWVLGSSILAFLLGVVYCASGVTRFMNGVPDPGARLIYAAFALNGLPMVLVAAGAFYDKYGDKFKAKPPKPVPAETRPTSTTPTTGG